MTLLSSAILVLCKSVVSRAAACVGWDGAAVYTGAKIMQRFYILSRALCYVGGLSCGWTGTVACRHGAAVTSGPAGLGIRCFCLWHTMILLLAYNVFALGIQCFCAWHTMSRCVSSDGTGRVTWHLLVRLACAACCGGLPASRLAMCGDSRMAAVCREQVWNTYIYLLFIHYCINFAPRYRCRPWRLSPVIIR